MFTGWATGPSTQFPKVCSRLRSVLRPWGNLHRAQTIAPVWEGVMILQMQGIHFLTGDFLPLLVGGFIKSRADPQTGLCRRSANVPEHDLQSPQGSACPVQADLAE